MKTFLKILSIIFLFQTIYSGYPIAVFHGLGDMCLLPPMRDFANFLGKNSNSISHCFESGGIFQDYITSFKSQGQKACNHLKNNSEFQGKDISVVGLSQGGLIARYIVEECDFGGSVKVFVSIGGPQMGVTAFPSCGKSGFVCDLINKVTDEMVYYSFIQNHIGPAGYFNLYSNQEAYLKGSTFLAELNNEKITEKSETSKTRLESIDKMVLIKFEKDTILVPKETAWFQFYNENKELLNFRETKIYKEDLIGLKALDDNNKIVFESIDGDHLEFTEADLLEKVVPYLK